MDTVRISRLEVSSRARGGAEWVEGKETEGRGEEGVEGRSGWDLLLDANTRKRWHE